MIDRQKVLAGLESCADSTGALCRTCPYDFVHNENCMGDMARDALELLKNEPSTSTEDTSYQRLMAMNRDLIERNTNLAEEAQKLARFNDYLTMLCEALVKKVYADETR